MTPLRFRSNVVVIASEADRVRARQALPGEVAGDLLPLDRLTTEQSQERALYGPCVRCRRSLFRIAQFGCEAESCASLARARAVLDAEQLFREVREQAVAPAQDEGVVEVEAGRGHVESIPEWHPS